MCSLNKFNCGFKLFKQYNGENVIYYEFTLKIILHEYTLWGIQDVDLLRFSYGEISFEPY